MLYIKLQNDDIDVKCKDCDIAIMLENDNWCPALDCKINPDEKHCKCPIKELKPKQLEWKEDGDWIKAEIGETIISINEDNRFKDDYRLYAEIETPFFIKDDIDLYDEGCRNINDAKDFFQNYFNKLFNEMIG